MFRDVVDSSKYRYRLSKEVSSNGIFIRNLACGGICDVVMPHVTPTILLMGPYDIDKYHNLVAIIDEMTAVKLQDILVNSMEDGMKYVELKTTLP